FSRWYACSSWGTAFSQATKTHMFTGDFNGDGNQDFMWTWKDTSVSPAVGEVLVLLSTGSSFYGDGAWVSGSSWAGVLAATTDTNMFVGDFNGDGRTDYMFTWDNGDGTGSIWAGIGTGHAFDMTEWAHSTVASNWDTVFKQGSHAHMFTGNFNG